MAEPFSEDAREQREKQTAKQRAAMRARILAYKRCFSTASGQAVLADLKERFGFDRCEAESETLSDNIIARRTCMKMPIFHIEKMRGYTFRDNGTPKRAAAGHHHEDTAPPASG